VEELWILKVASLLNMTGIIPIIDRVSTESFKFISAPSKTYYVRCLPLL
jgi:hypothetical protein